MNPVTGMVSAQLCRTARATGSLARCDGAAGTAIVLVGGPDATAFLQSQLTSDVAGLAPGQGHLSARLTRSGALVAHFPLHRLPERGQPFPTYVLLPEIGQTSLLLEDLARSAVSEDVWLDDGADEFTGWIVQGPKAADLLNAVPAGPLAAAIVLAQSFTGDPDRLVLVPAQGADLEQLLTSAAREAGFALLDELPNGTEAWRWLYLEAGLPRAGEDYEPGRTQLGQTGLESRVVNAGKGCYLGQEVVARVRAYGSVPRALRALVIGEPRGIEPDRLPVPGSPLRTVEEEKIGAWASAGYSVARDCTVALAYLDREHRTPGSLLSLAAGDLDVEAEVALLPLFAGDSAAARAEALHEQAVRLFSRGEDRRAVALLEEAVALDPRATEAYEALGVILGRTERFHEAIDVFQRLEEIAPEEPMVHTNLSLFYMKIGDREEAERQKALATRKKFGSALGGEELALMQQAEAENRRVDAERRRTMFADVLEVDPEDPLALMGMGNALLDLGDAEAAADWLGRAQAVQPDNSPLYVARGKALEALGRSDEAGEAYRAGVAVASRKGDLMPLKEMEHRLFLLERG